MQERSFIQLFPALMEWPPAVTDVGLVPSGVTRMRMNDNARGGESLVGLTQLESVWCFNINTKAIQHISRCTGLKSLYIEFLKVQSLEWVSRLENLTVLSLERNYKIESLAELAGLRHLECLRITNFKKVHDISVLSSLKDLRQLAVEGGMWTRMKLDTLKPISSLTKLEYLNLTSLRSDDRSLRPLGELVGLKLLDIANAYPMEEFAWLSGKLRNTECTWFQPYINLANGFFCKKCDQKLLVMCPGSGARTICKHCDADKLAKHVDRFNDIAARARGPN
jgi:hypothetical protein